MALGDFDFVIACNDVGAIWPGHLSAWVSLHPEKLGRWRDQRRANGHPEAARHMTHGDYLPSWAEQTEFRFPGQDRSGSSGLFAVKVALMELGAERAVLAGIPLERSSHFFDREQWEAAVGYRAAWESLRPCYRARMRSMSGWTAQLLGAPTADWINGKACANEQPLEIQSMTKIVTDKIAYEPHPVAPERKAELRAQGFKIIDARFKPAGAVEPETGSADTNGDGKVSIAEIRNALTAKGIEFDPKTKKAELQALLEQAEQSEAIKVQLAEKGIEPPADATLETLQQLLEGTE